MKKQLYEVNKDSEFSLHLFFPFLSTSLTEASIKTKSSFFVFVLQVLIAVGRDACTDKIGLDKAGVKVNPK